jgi:hypothetical protein
MAIRSDGMEPKGREGGKGALTSSFCRPHKRRTARESSSGGEGIFLGDGRWKRRNSRRESRNYV